MRWSRLLIAALLFSGALQAAPTLDAFDSNSTGSAVTSLDLTGLAVGAGSNMVIYVFAEAVGASDTVNSVVYDPGGGDEANFTSVGSQAGAGSAVGEIEIWRLSDADIVNSTTKTIRINTSLTRISGIAVSFTGVDQADPDDAPSGANAKNANGTDTINITTATDDLAIGFCAVHNESSTDWDSGNDMTEVDSSLPLSMPTMAIYTTVGSDTDATSVPARCTWDASSRDWIIMGFNVNAVAAAGSSIPAILLNMGDL